MIWAATNTKELFFAGLVIWGLGLACASALRWCGWSWWARIGVLIPVFAVAARFIYRVLNTTTFILL